MLPGSGTNLDLDPNPNPNPENTHFRNLPAVSNL